MTVGNLSSDSGKVVNYHTWCLPLFLTANRQEILVCFYKILLIELLKVTDAKKVVFFLQLSYRF